VKLYRGAQTSGGTVTAFVYVANAGYSESAAILGLAYHGSSIFLFEKVMRQHSGGLGQVPLQTLESAVLAHEFGHVMGLVNNGISMVDPHQDQQNGRHCNTKNCLMYYATETTDLLGNLLGSSVPELDAACLADVHKEKTR